MDDIEHPGEFLATDGENSWQAKQEAAGAFSIFSGPKAAKEYRRGIDRTEAQVVRHGQRFTLSAWFGNGFGNWTGLTGGNWTGIGGWTDAGCRPRYGTGGLPPPIPNISARRWSMPILERDQERELIRRAQAGDRSAGDEIFKHFHRTIISIANSVNFDALGWDERIQIGAEGLQAAVMRFNLRWQFRLSGYAGKYIRGFLFDAVKLVRKDGMQDVPDRRSKGGEVWVANLGTEYNEAAADRGYEEDASIAERGARAVAEDATEGAPLAYSGRDRAGVPGGIQSNPFEAEKYRLDEIEVRILNVAPRDIPFALERIADDEDRRAARRLKEIGRRAYALELVEKDRRRRTAETQNRFTTQGPNHYGRKKLHPGIQGNKEFSRRNRTRGRPPNVIQVRLRKACDPQGVARGRGRSGEGQSLTS